MIYEPSVELQAYLDMRFARIEETLEDIRSMLEARGHEYGVVMQSVRLIAQAVSIRDSIDELVVTMGQKQAAKRRKK